MITLSAYFFRMNLKISEKPQHATHVSTLKMPATVEPPDQEGRRCSCGPDVEERPPSRHQSIHFARHYGPEGLRFLRHQPNVAFREARSQILVTNVWPKGSISDRSAAARVIQVFALRPASDEIESEAGVARQPLYDSTDCRYLVRQT
jgi:hypothetical protein